MTKIIESNTILEVTDDKGVIHIIANSKVIVIVVDTGFPFRNTPHYMSLVFCETNVRYYQYKTKAATYHYL